jgi:signal transduction histidine kinase
MDWNGTLPRLLHDGRALLRKSHGRAQLLERRIGSTLDPESKALLDAVVSGHRQLDQFFVRVGVWADCLVNEDDVAIPLSAVVSGVRLASRSNLAAVGGRFEAATVVDCHVPGRLQLALQELLDNSLRFAAEGRPPAVSLSTEALDGRLRIRYADNGPGWDPAYTPKILLPFERLDSARGGFGLGLAIADAVVRNAGGTLEALTGAEGSQFVMELPLQQSRSASPVSS